MVGVVILAKFRVCGIHDDLDRRLESTEIMIRGSDRLLEIGGDLVGQLATLISEPEHFLIVL
jgi:hypothetical protein